MINQFNIGDIIQHKSINDDYYYIVLNTFHRDTYEFYTLFSFIEMKEVPVRANHSIHYKIVSKA